VTNLNQIAPTETSEFGTDTTAAPRLIEPGDHERFSHYVKREKIVESAVMGTPVIALCGKVWVPGRDPKNFPICPACKEIHSKLKPGDEDKN
jgi:hypothetical protein